MKFYRLSPYILVLLVVSIVISGCGVPHPGLPFFIDGPDNHSLSPLGHPIVVKLRTTIPPDPSRNFLVQIYDNGNLLSSSFYPGTFTYTDYPIASPPAGANLISALGMEFDSSGHGSGWYETQVICVFVGTPPTVDGQPYFCQSSYIQSDPQYDSVGPTSTPTAGILQIQIMPTISPTPTLGNLTILPTATPASALDCPSGTYFADVTHQCIAIATPTTSNGSTVECSKITSSSVCNSTPGCHFNITAKACQKK